MNINVEATSELNAAPTQPGKLIAHAKPAGTTVLIPSAEESKAIKAGKDFESILLGSWLQQAEQSFAKVPGGDGQDDEDTGGDQFRGIAMQALAGSLTASGGIGIAKIITQQLQSASAGKQPSQEAMPPNAPQLSQPHLPGSR